MYRPTQCIKLSIHGVYSKHGSVSNFLELGTSVHLEKGLLLLMMMIPEDQQSYIRSMSLFTLKKSKVNRGLETRSCWESPRHARI
ncbi:hypothetical protein AVEN_76499-1 [Araneus ventricosus]|uniref:Uncharacterized protein n=1 Tax=Araneus ventricosus TaxID=182803 RepID=A0A4Y2CDX4_ARAVE|nr:hypothetical protein AVEN_76499-1 [Araneus ventricosus]